MAFAALQADFSQFNGVQAKIDRLLGLMGNELPEGIGAILETSARRRISTTKAGPDGVPWQEWSRSYAARRPAGKSLLSDSGGLQDSLDFMATRDQVLVFAAAEHAATHQFGDHRLITVREHKRMVTQVFGRPVPGGVEQTVGKHHALRNIPARPFLGLGDEDVAEIELLIDNLAERGLRV